MRPVGSSSYNYIYSNFSELEQQKVEDGSISKESTSSSATYGSFSGVEADVKKLLEEIPKGDDNKLSFREVEDYRKNLEEKWDKEVKEDLAKLGVNTDLKLGLSYDPATGKVTAGAGHPQKDIIDQYFESNQDKIDDFDKIIRLGKLTRTSEQKLTESELRKSIQMQAMTWWSEANMDSSDYFSGGGTLLGLAAEYKGINLKV